MSKYIHWYLVELEHGLAGLLPQDKVQELQDEVENHLLDTTESLVQQGVERKKAERLAVGSFGPPKRFIRDTIRYCKNAKPYRNWRVLQSVLVLTLVAGICLATFNKYLIDVLVLELLFLVAFGVTFGMRHAPSRALVLCSALLCVGVAGVSGFFVLSSRTGNFLASEAHERISSLKWLRNETYKSLVLLKKGRQVYSSDPQKPGSVGVVPPELMIEGEFIAPSPYNEFLFEPKYAYSGSEVLSDTRFEREPPIRSGSVRVKSIENAATLWRANAPAREAYIRGRMLNIDQDIKYTEWLVANKPYNRFYAMQVLILSMGWTFLAALPSMLLASWLGSVLARLQFRRRALV